MPVTRGQLDIQLERLEECFGDKHFGEQRSRMIWLAVDGLEYNDVITIVDTFIKRSKHAPLPQDFTDAAREYKRTGGGKLGECAPREIAKCFDCADSGLVQVARKPGHEAWAKYDSGSACCHCDRGRQALEALRRRPRQPVDLVCQYDERWRSSYAIVPWHSGPAPTYTFAPGGAGGGE